MRRISKKSIILIIFGLLGVSFFIQGGKRAKAHRPIYYRYNLLDSIYYLETSADYNIGDLIQHNDDFKKLEKDQNQNLSKLVSNTNNLLWLKIEFSVPNELKGKELGIFIGHLRSSAQFYLNGKFIRKYGNTPPTEMTSGYTAQYYMFSRGDIFQERPNTAYIQVWAGPWGALSKNIFLGEQADIFPYADRKTFFNSKITITFSCISLFIALLYMLLAVVLKKTDENQSYMLYALTNLCTSLFLVIFFITEISWIKPPFIPFLAILKFSICFGGFATAYFATSFIISCLGHKPKIYQLISRLILILIPIIIGCAIPTYSAFIKVIPYLIGIVMLQFVFSSTYLIRYIFDKNRRKNVVKMLQGFTPVFIALILDLICHIALGYDDIPYITIYGWQCTIYVFLWQLIKDFGVTYIHNLELRSQLQDFNSNLESVVALRTQELSEANYVLSRGLETVAHVQKNFLPRTNNMFKGWDVSVYYQPLDNNVSGDLYDYYFTQATLEGAGIFDVSGHGIPAGLMTILAKGIISQHFLNGLAQEESISDILKQINETYIKEKVNVENYITGLLFHFSEFNKNDVCSVEVANAGHPYPILYNAEKDEFSEIKHDNPDQQYGIIGVEGLDVSFPPVSFRMGIDDIIISFTDGITEALNENREDFSKERLINIVKENKNQPATVITEKVISALKDFTKNVHFSDDITLMILKRTDSREYIEEI